VKWKFWEPRSVLTPEELLEMQRQSAIVKNNGERLKDVKNRTDKVVKANHLGENLKKAMGGYG
jgi:hypothetical protein